ncbi:MAG: LamB/YcsF family protein, partial [Desulfosarcina sp.]
AFCRAHGAALQHVKPHGALYNMAVGNEPLARAIAEAVASVDANLMLVTLAGDEAPLMARIGRETGLRVVYEAFPDRAYTAQGRLVSRRLPGAVIHDPAEAAARALTMARDGRIVAIDGTPLEMEIHTLCVHGDTPTALALVAEIQRTLVQAGVTLRPMGAAD